MRFAHYFVRDRINSPVATFLVFLILGIRPPEDRRIRIVKSRRGETWAVIESLQETNLTD